MVSHGGLTFGGFLVGEKMTQATMLEVFDSCKRFLRELGFTELIYKAMPVIYHKYPCDEDKYALFVNDAELFRRDVSATIYLPNRYKYSRDRSQRVNRGRKNKIVVRQSERWAEYVDLLNEVLSERHGAKAVHTAAELELLAGRFPDNIKLYTGELDGELLAGAVIFVNGETVHTQYLANSNDGRKIGALDAVIDHLLTEVYADKKFFDFGISNEDNGRYLNCGLIAQKEGFGARAVVHDFYRLRL